jgi:signal transduction histidine kinase
LRGFREWCCDRSGFWYGCESRLGLHFAVVVAAVMAIVPPPKFRQIYVVFGCVNCGWVSIMTSRIVVIFEPQCASRSMSNFVISRAVPIVDRSKADSKPHILIVDGQNCFASNLQYQFNLFGYATTTIATTASEALQQASLVLPDLVLVDVQLQDDLDGLELSTELWTNFGLPVVYIADRDQMNDQHQPVLLQCNQAPQCYGVLFTPLDELDVLNTIQSAIGRHQKESSLQQQLQEYQEKAALKSRLVEIVSHEFRNPLNTILFSVELLKRYHEQISDDKRHTYFERIDGAVQRMNQLIDDVLMIDATKAGDLLFQPFAVDLVAFCKEVIQEFQPYTGDVVEFMGEISIDPVVMVDEKLIRHILTNLIANAIKYSPQGAMVEFHLTLDAQKVVFTIRDQGIGITLDDQAQLFTAFYRGRNARRIPGTGLGLSIVKQCAELHRGTVTVESQPGHGSAFTVMLPLGDAAGLFGSDRAIAMD